MSALAKETLEFLEQHARGTVSVSALHGGTFTLPLNLFVASATDQDRSTVPSLCFLLAHTDAASGQTTKTVFDLGLRRDTDGYIAPIREHLATRQPLDTALDTRQSLLDGGVPPAEIARVIVSHVHWDHTGTPADYPHARFWVGHGALDVLAHGLGAHLGHQHFERDLFAGVASVQEFPPPSSSDEGGGWQHIGGGGDDGNGNGWALYDVLGDGAVYVVDAPGHLPGHVNLLARVGARRWVYLGGDACHDRRLLTGAEAIAQWTDAVGRMCCIHTDKALAEATLARIRDLQAAADETGVSVQVILAHDKDWAEAHPDAFLPGTIQ